MRHRPAAQQIARKAPALWAELAAQHDGKDRWYLEALGIGADKQWDAYLGRYLKQAGSEPSNTPAGRDIIWRSRAKANPGAARQNPQGPRHQGSRPAPLLPGFDFLTGPEKEAALKSLLE